MVVLNGEIFGLWKIIREKVYNSLMPWIKLRKYLLENKRSYEQIIITKLVTTKHFTN